MQAVCCELRISLKGEREENTEVPWKVEKKERGEERTDLLVLGSAGLNEGSLDASGKSLTFSLGDDSEPHRRSHPQTILASCQVSIRTAAPSEREREKR
jgi:hypothetical protein